MTDADVYRRAAERLLVHEHVYEALAEAAGTEDCADSLFGKWHWWMMPVPFEMGWNQEVRVLALCLMAAIAESES